MRTAQEIRTFVMARMSQFQTDPNYGYEDMVDDIVEAWVDDKNEVWSRLTRGDADD